MLVVGYTPFIDPVTEWSQGFIDWWWASLPLLALLVATSYKAVRLVSLEGFWRHVLVMTLQITLAMLGIALAIGLAVEVVMPLLA